jgi:hypothetical protein
MREEYDGDDGTVNRRLRLALGGVAALLIGGTLVAPVVLRGGGGSKSSCSTTLYYSGRPYTVRALDGAAVVQAISVGVGVMRGCGAAPQNVNVRSLGGVPPARALGLEGVQTEVYVRRGVCVHAAPRALPACLTR